MPRRLTPQVEPTEPEGYLIGYARVSTAEQSLQMQIDALTRAGVAPENIYSEQVSGVSKRRYQLGLAMKACRAGDTFVVWKLDRMGRSLLDLLAKFNKLEAEGVRFKSLTEGIDTTTPGGRLLMHMMGALAQFERDLVVERTRAGVRAHIARGGRIGAERKMTPEAQKRALAMFKAGKSVREIAAELNVKPQTIYSYYPGGPAKWGRRR